MDIVVFAIVTASMYALIEFIYTSFFDYDWFKGFSRRGNKYLVFPPQMGETTWAMVPGSMLCAILFMRPFAIFLTGVSNPTYYYGYQVIFWPCIIWLFEIIFGSYLYYSCNKTRAWEYRGKNARLNGFIKLTYFPAWIFLGMGFTEFYKVFELYLAPYLQ